MTTDLYLFVTRARFLRPVSSRSCEIPLSELVPVFAAHPCAQPRFEAARSLQPARTLWPPSNPGGFGYPPRLAPNEACAQRSYRIAREGSQRRSAFSGPPIRPPGQPSGFEPFRRPVFDPGRSVIGGVRESDPPASRAARRTWAPSKRPSRQGVSRVLAAERLLKTVEVERRAELLGGIIQTIGSSRRPE